MIARATLACVLLFAVSSAAHAAPCGPHVFTPADQVKLGTDSALIVTHPSTQWDGRFSSKLGMDAAVKFAKHKKMPVVYLQDVNNGALNDTYFFSDCDPTYWVQSDGGEFSFEPTARHIYSVGGHWERCQATTMGDLMSRWAKLPQGDLVLTQALDGIYSSAESLDQGDDYYPAFKAFMGVVTYGRPDAWPFPKLNLLETMGIIQDLNHQISYLKRNLPPFSKLGKAYTVEMIVNGLKMETLQKGAGAKPPKLKLEYVNSLYDEGWIPGKR